MSEEKEAAEDVKTQESTALAIREVMTLGTVFAASGMFPTIKSQAQAVVKILAGRELGFAPVYSMTKVYVIEGKVAIAAEALGARIKASGNHDYKVTELTDTRCALQFYSNGKPDYLSIFTIQDAQRAGLIKPGGGWQKWPRAMLMSKALSQGARIVCPHIISGVYVPEDFGFEVDDEGVLVQQADVIDTQQQDSRVYEAEVVEHTEGTEDTSAEAQVDFNPETVLSKCPKHNEEWVLDSWGNLQHITPLKDAKGKPIYCKAYKILWDYFTPLCEKCGLDNKGAVDDWLKDNFGGLTWSKMSDQQRLQAIEMMRVMATEKGSYGSLVDEALEMGAEIDEEEV